MSAGTVAMQPYLCSSSFCFVPVMFHVQFGRFCCVVSCVVRMAMGRVRMMRGGLMVAVFVVLGGFAMVPGCVFMMFRCLVMMLRCLSGHLGSPLSEGIKYGRRN
jgi:hypothetical protein